MDFQRGQFYHVYNRGNNSQPIFFTEGNFIFFLKKVRDHLSPLIKVVSYCLMPNHFHFMVYVPDSPGDSESPGELSKQITDAIAIILRSYTRAINKKYNRTGSLFQQSTRAKLLENRDRNYPFICFHYIHQNPVTANLVKTMDEWIFSSYIDYAGLRDGTLCNKSLAYDFLEIPKDVDEFIRLSECESI
ncbi:MAG: transposase [Fulvivirga sp.]